MRNGIERRDLFGGCLALAGAIAASSVVAVTPAAAAGAGAGVSPDLLDLFEAFRKADAALNDFYAREFNPVIEAHWAAVRRHEAAVAAIPHVRESGGVSIGGKPITFCSSKSYSRSHADHYIETDAQNPDRGADWDETIEAARRFVRVDDKRRAKLKRLGDVPDCDPSLDDREEIASKPSADARSAIHAFSCATLADLQAKLDWIEADTGMDGEDLLPMVIGDVARLINRGKA